jgi:hypothetical protein
LHYLAFIKKLQLYYSSALKTRDRDRGPLVPQFDFFCFQLQTFWFLVSFIVFHGFCYFYYLPALAEVLKMRTKLYNYYVEQKLVKINLRDFFLIHFFKN